MHIDSKQLEAFAAVLREGSFEAAARALFVTPSAVSQRVKQLEDQLGRVLIQRGAPCQPTTAGQTLQKYAQQLRLLEAEALDVLGVGEERGARVPMVIAVNADSLATWLAPALAGAQAKLGLTFDLIVEDQDHSRELLRAGRVMGAITTDAQPVQGCETKPLGAMRYLAVASPAFFERHFAGGVNAAALARAPSNEFNRKDALQARYLQMIVGDTLVGRPRHFVPSTHGFVEAARSGLGWGMNPKSLVNDLIRRGELRELKKGVTLDVPLYWQHWRLESVALKMLSREIQLAAQRARLTVSQKPIA
jgi:LysR family transcriptional regulator, chromosome initiation inhibitor